MKRLKLKRKSERWVSNNRVLLGQSKKDPGRNPNFDTEETKLLISLWGDPALQRTLITTHRKHTVIAKLAEKMGEYGYTRSAEEINTRIKNLKCFYNRLKKDMESGAINSSTWRHFGAMDEIMTRSIFSVRPNEIPKPSLRYRLEVEKAEQEEKDRVEAALTRADKATKSNAQVSDENLLTSSGESSAEEVLEENDARMNCDENAIMEYMESGGNHVKIKEEDCSDSVSRDIEDASLLIPKEEPLDDDTDVQIISSDSTKTMETAMPRIQDFIQISNNALSSQCRPLVNGILSNNTLQASASSLTPGLTQSIVFANQPNTMQTGNKISLVPTNFLLQQNPKQTQQIQIRQQPQQRIICSQANTQPGNGIVTSAGAGGMKVLLVNRFQNGKPTNGVVTKESSFTTSNLITTPSIHKTNITEVPLLSKKTTAAEPAKPVRTEDAATTKDPVLEMLFNKLIVMQNENNEIQRQRLEIERQRLDFEKSVADKLLAALSSFGQAQKPDATKSRKRSAESEPCGTEKKPPDQEVIVELNDFQLLTPKVEKID